ncbi:hypothetical protein [Bacillus safensis]|uniref:hypothetical protein n=1 Tax=Bacillus safensis TaxID=561879 RepID=UPI003657A27E
MANNKRVPQVERPEGGWPVRVVEHCGCPVWLREWVGPASFHEDAAQFVRCVFDKPLAEVGPNGWSSTAAAVAFVSFDPTAAFVEGVDGWYAFVQNSPGHPCVTLHHTLAEAQAHQERYFEAIGQYEPWARHRVLDLTAVKDEGTVTERLRRSREELLSSLGLR